MPKKSRFRGPLDKHHGKGDQTLLKPEPPPLAYLLITLKAIEIEKVSLSDTQNLRTVC